jgi:hypothetical protein
MRAAAISSGVAVSGPETHVKLRGTAAMSAYKLRIFTNFDKTTLVYRTMMILC